jgi:hypothetical protein
MSDRLHIVNEMREFDRKNRKFFDELTEEEKKKFSPFLMIRWGSVVEGSRELQEFYVIATNERLNKHFFDVNTTRHKKLQWLMATSVSPDLGTHRHVWIAPAKRNSTKNSHQKQISQLFPNLRDDEVELMSQINTKEDVAQWIKLHGEHDV